MVSPSLLSRLLYWSNFGESLNLKNPNNICEKMQWLKLNTYFNNPLITKCVDKFRVREYLKEKKCSELLNQLIDVWDYVGDINWEQLPDKFVIKCNHGCGYNIICSEKNKFDIDDAQRKLLKWMKEDFWKIFAEVNYKYVEKKIICEAYLSDGYGKSLRDYKFFCINGKPEVMEVCMNRQENSGHPDEFFFDMNFNYLPPQKNNSSLVLDNKNLPEKPYSFEQMKSYASILSEDFPFVRVDFYEVDKKPIFSELTFTSAGGFDKTLMDACPEFGKNLEVV